MSASTPSRLTLSPTARSFLKKAAHSLKPTVQVGNQGFTEGVVAATDQALRDHELIKVKVGQSYEGDRKALAEQLADATGAGVAQVIGRVLTLYRPHKPHERKPTSLKVPA